MLRARKADEEVAGEWAGSVPSPPAFGARSVDRKNAGARTAKPQEEKGAMGEVVLRSIEAGQLVVNAGYVLIGLAVFFVVRMLMQEQESLAAQENLDELRSRKSSSSLVRLTRPLFSQYFLPMVRGKPRFDKLRERYRKSIPAAGLRDEFSPDELIAFKLLLVLLFPVIGGFLQSAELIEVDSELILLSGALGWYYPDFWMKQLTEARQKAILRAMPFVVDLLSLSTEAGLDFTGAIGRVVEKAKPSPLVDEFAQFLKEIKLGASRATGLRDMAARVGMKEFNSFVAILISADQMGASIGKILRQQSEQIRVERMLRAEKAGAAASQKIILPTIVFVFPAIILLIAGPFIVQYFTGGEDSATSQRAIASEER
jgi:tight adherence protein C